VLPDQHVSAHLYLYEYRQMLHVFYLPCICVYALWVQKFGRRQSQQEAMHAVLLRHHELTQDFEFRHLDLLHKLRDSHMARQHQMEKENQETYTATALRDLKHKHATATKQLPKNLKVSLDLGTMRLIQG